MNVLVNFSSCLLTVQSGVTQIYGHSFYVYNNLARLSFVNCTVYNISSTNTPFIYAPRINTLYMRDSSFANINNTNTNATGGCFYTEMNANLSLSRCTFTLCASGNSAGVGYVYYLTASGSLIDACTFSNSSAANYGVLHIFGDDGEPLISIVNTTCYDCTASAGGGGAFSLYSYLKANVSRCAFVGCTSGGTDGFGAALYIHMHTAATVDRCTFLNCGARYGSAIYVFDLSSVVVSNSVLMNNTVVGGTHVHGNNSASVTIIDNNTFSDGTNNPLYCDGTSVCTGALQSRILYNAASCQTTFDAPIPIDNHCTMPCAASNGNCVKPDACPANHVSAAGLCIPECSFWRPWRVGTLLTCPALCSGDTQKGYPLCVTACAVRLWNVSALFPCGSADCYLDSAAPAEEGLQCITTCTANAHHTGEGVEGVCTLKECPQRTRNASAAHVCGSSDCFYNAAAGAQQTQTPCVSSCVTDGFHTGEVVKEECVLKECGDRTADTTADIPCGTNNCLYDENMTAQAGKKCVVACATAHYRTESSNASCVLKLCTARLRNESATLPCATPDCFYDPYARALAGEQCVNSCPKDNMHTGDGADGVCTMTVCEDRVRNISAPHPCGSADCYYDSAGSAAAHTQCTSTCVEDNIHSGLVVNDECMLKTCTQRVANLSTDQPCGGYGGLCYFNPTAPALVGMQCLVNCTENLQLSGSFDQATMTCQLKPCPERLQNASTIFPCGTADCFYDTTKTVEPKVGQQCGLACDVSGYEPDLSTGICVTKPPEAVPEEDPAAAKARQQAKAGVALGVVALVLAIIALAGVVFLIVYCYFCGKKDGYKKVINS